MTDCEPSIRVDQQDVLVLPTERITLTGLLVTGIRERVFRGLQIFCDFFFEFEDFAFMTLEDWKKNMVTEFCVLSH